MNTKILVGVLVVLVALVAFLAGRLYQEPATVETEVAEAQAAEEVAGGEAEMPEPVEPPPSTPAAARRRAPEPVRSELPSEPPPPPPATAPAATPAPTEPEPPPPPPESVRVRLTEGTTIAFTLNNSLSTKTNQTGDSFSGRVSRPVRVGDTTVIPQGATIRGTVGHVQRPGRVKGVAEMSLRFDQLVMPGGETYDLSASLAELNDKRKEQVTEEGQVKGETSKKRDAITIGGGAGIGAAIGAIAGGGKGAGTGAAIGAGAGTAAVLLTRGKDIELQRGTELALQLDRPLSVAIEQ